MSAEGSYQRQGPFVSGPFAKSDDVLVSRGSSVACSLDVGDNGASDESLIAEASFGQSCGSVNSNVVCAKSGACDVVSLREWSNSGDEFRHVISISVPNCANYLPDRTRSDETG